MRTYSEALCETIGSLMLLAFSSGRGLHPPNLNKEICIRYNAPPLHILKEKFIPIVTNLLESGLNKKKKNLDLKERRTTDETESLNSSQSVPQSAIKG